MSRPRQVKTEGVHGFPQPGQPVVGQYRAAVGPQRRVDNVEVGQQLRRGPVALEAEIQLVLGLVVQDLLGGRGEPGVDDPQGAPVRFVGARGLVARVGQRRQLVAHPHQTRRHRQLFLERRDFAEVVCERGIGGAGCGQPDDVGGDIRVAVTVAADPGPGPQDRLLEQVRVRPTRPQRRAYFGVHLRDDLEEGRRVITQTGFDLILNLQPRQPDQRRLPQRQDVTAQFGFDVAAILRVRVAMQAQPHQLGDAVLGVEDRAATSFGGMRGDHR